MSDSRRVLAVPSSAMSRRSMGLSPARARDRGLLAYTAFLGHAQLAHATPELLPSGRAFKAHVDQVTETLMRLGD